MLGDFRRRKTREDSLANKKSGLGKAALKLISSPPLLADLEYYCRGDCCEEDHGATYPTGGINDGPTIFRATIKVIFHCHDFLH